MVTDILTEFFKKNIRLEIKGLPLVILSFPDSSVGKDSACNAGDPGLIPGLGRSTGEGIEQEPHGLEEPSISKSEVVRDGDD